LVFLVRADVFIVMPANNFAIVATWLAVIGVVGCVTAVAVVAKKRGE
jgi:hypothetical protein